MQETILFVCGSELGYIPVARRYHCEPVEPVPQTLEGLRGNFRKFVRECHRHGCTQYTMYWAQGVPGKGYSNRFCYRIYKGYRL